MSSSPRFFAGDARRRHHFLDSCFLCKKRIPKNEDIFMYRGDAPFCSMECRREQMDMDEALENERILCSASYSPASASAQPSPMKRKPTLISIPAKCDEKNRYRPDTAAIVAR